MKRKIKIFLSFVLAIVFFTLFFVNFKMDDAEKLKPMTIKNQEISEPEKDLMNISGEGYGIFNFKTDDTIKKLKILQYVKKDGKWEKKDLGAIGFVNDKNYGSIFLRAGKKDSVIALKTNMSGYSVNADGLNFDKNKGGFTIFMSDKKDIEEGKEIALFGKFIQNGQSTMMTNALDDFEKVDCDEALVFAVIFSNEKV